MTKSVRPSAPCAAIRRFAAAVVLITAFAIGANTAVFTLVNAVLLSPLPFADPSRLVEVTGRRAESDREPLSLPDYRDLREATGHSRVSAATFQWSANITGGLAERLQGMRASANSSRARDAGPRSAERSCPKTSLGSGRRVVVLSHGLWMRRFAADPAVVGTSIVLNGDSHTIVGVLPRDFVTPIREAEADRPVPDGRRSAPRRRVTPDSCA